MWLDSQDGHEGASNRVPGKQKYSQFSSFTSGKHCTIQQYMGRTKWERRAEVSAGL